jgi:hypothetical protein
VLSFVDKHGVDQKRERDEDFMNVIVNLAGTLYEGLDAAFNTSEVELEGMNVQRTVTVKALPPILCISINVSHIVSSFCTQSHFSTDLLV